MRIKIWLCFVGPWFPAVGIMPHSQVDVAMLLISNAIADSGVATIPKTKNKRTK